MVTVRLFGRLRTLLNEDTIVVQGSPSTLGELVRMLSEQRGARIGQELLDQAGEIDYSYAVFIGGQRASSSGTPVDEGQEVIITSMLAGGTVAQSQNSFR